MRCNRFAAAVLILICGATARADEASGTWTGYVELRSNYYWERSTRVVAPTVAAEVISPDGIRLRSHYLVDSITSASQAAGLQTDVRFTETRHEVDLGVGREFDLGDFQLDVGAIGRTSYEPDYTSVGGTVTSALSLNERVTVLRLNATFTHDTIGKILRGADRAEGGSDLSDRGTVGELDSFVLSIGITQVLAPTWTLDVGYDFGVLTGFQNNPYRQASVQGIPLDEQHPSERLRHTLSARLSWYLRPTHTALQALQRLYVDSWDILALTPELRVYQEIGAATVLRLRYRYYTQARSFFYQPAYPSTQEYFTADPKMSPFHSHQLGAQVVVGLTALEDTPLEFASEATIDLTYDMIWNTNRYGDGVIAQASLRVPF